MVLNIILSCGEYMEYFYIQIKNKGIIIEEIYLSSLLDIQPIKKIKFNK